jgi:hypothetical protein
MRAQAAILVTAALVGCTQEQVLTKVSARLVGCPPEEVVLGDVYRWYNRPIAWTASCGSRVWACQTQGGLTCRYGRWECRNSWGRITCGEAEQAPSD